MKEITSRSTPVSIVVAVLLWLGVVLALFLVAPVFSSMYHDFGARIPQPTRLTFAFTAWLRGYWFLTLPLFLGAVIWAAVAQMKIEKHRMLFPISGGIVALLLLITLFLPVFIQ